jgi:RNA polymerase sigma-70 factor (ECF subfamily)
MPSTRISLIDDARAGSKQGWRELVATYEPVVFRWFKREGLSHEQAADLTQDAMAVVVRELVRFEHSGRVGSFRRWLREITIHRLLAFRRSQRRREQAVGGSSFLRRLHDIESDESELSERWDREFNRGLIRRLLAGLADEFGPVALAAFRMVTVERREPAEVAGELGLSVGAVYSAKSRVLRRLRQEAARFGCNELD